MRFRKAEEDYFTCQRDFMQHEGEMVDDLKKALATVDDKETVLRLLLEMTLGLTPMVPLVAGILDLAVDSSNLYTIDLARAVLSHYKSEPWVRACVQTSVKNYLPENDEWHYRRIAELYKLLDYKEELADFLLLCQASNNREIREIVDDFQGSS